MRGAWRGHGLSDTKMRRVKTGCRATSEIGGNSERINPARRPRSTPSGKPKPKASAREHANANVICLNVAGRASEEEETTVSA